MLGGVACGAAVCYHTYFHSKVPGQDPPIIPTADSTTYMGHAVTPAHMCNCHLYTADVHFGCGHMH